MSQREIDFYLIDAFTSSLFSGNPAAVCILDQPKPDSWLQRVAAEFNLSETAFLWQERDNHWQLRWFTPTCEVKLCGHATLASAHVLANERGLTGKEFHFSTLSGTLGAEVNDGKITLNFPRIQPTYLSKLYAHERGIDKLALDVQDYYQAGEDIIAVLESEQELVNYEPEIEKIATIETRGLIITAPSSNTERDFVSRFFAPRFGIHEDPVTGSAHCSLGPFWSRQLGKTELRAEQMSHRRGILNVKVNDTRVHLSGSCITFAKGRLSQE